MAIIDKKKELGEGVNATHKNIYDRISRFKRELHNQPEPILWFTVEEGEQGKEGLRVHYGTLEEYRNLGYGNNNDPDKLVFSLGTGVYVTLTQNLNSESVSKLERAVYAHVHEEVGL